MRPDRVIFLDFDGVIVHSESPVKGATLQPSRECIDRLNVILRATGAVIVVSSTWRIGRSISDLRGVLKAAGCEGLVVGATAQGIKTPAGLYVAAARCDEIRAWVKQYGARNCWWVALDDESMPEIAANMVHVDQGFYNGGLQDIHVALAIGKLNLGPAVVEPARGF